MKTKKSTSAAPAVAAFWDTSGIVPLCCRQGQTSQARQAFRAYRRQEVWWGTAIEAVSSFNRLVREGSLTVKESKQVFARLDYLRRHWNEIQPTEEVRELAERLLGSRDYSPP